MQDKWGTLCLERACMMRVCSLSSWSPTREYSRFSCATWASSSEPEQAPVGVSNLALKPLNPKRRHPIHIKYLIGAADMYTITQFRLESRLTPAHVLLP
jgi:hypothetical protein